MRLRAYRADDLDLLYAMDVRCFAPRFRFSREVMREVVEAPEARVAVACVGEDEGEEVLGFCAVTLQEESGERVGYLATLDVAPEHRGQGIGYALLAWAERTCRAEGARRVELHVWTENDGAVRLYERSGYGRKGAQRGFYGRGFNAHLLVKALG